MVYATKNPGADAARLAEFFWNVRFSLPIIVTMSNLAFVRSYQESKENPECRQ